MKKIIITFLFILSHLTYSEIYSRVGSENIMALAINLAEGEKFVRHASMYNDSGRWRNIDITAYVTYGNSRNKMEPGTVHGPCLLDFNTDENLIVGMMVYEIINLNNTDDSSTSDSKYTVSLNNDGTRLAIGEKNGTNSAARVYEYNDVTDAWEQLGDSVE